jgi:hypothetical protein
VTNGATNPNPFIFDVSQLTGNVQGTVTAQNGTKVAISEVTFVDLNHNPSSWYFQTDTNAEGKFALDLPDGQYLEMFVDQNGQESFLNQTFTVSDGKADPLTITLPTGHLDGTIATADPSSLKDAVINVTSQSTPNETVSETVDQSGQFTVGTSQDGSYEVTTATLSDGTLIIFNQSSTVKDGAGAVTLSIPTGQIKGTVTGFDQNVNGNYGGVYFKSTDDTTYYVAMKSDGTFNVDLPSGNYTITQAFVNGVTTDNIDQQVTVNDSATPVTINLN